MGAAAWPGTLLFATEMRRRVLGEGPLGSLVLVPPSFPPS